MYLISIIYQPLSNVNGGLSLVIFIREQVPIRDHLYRTGGSSEKKIEDEFKKCA